MDHSDLRLLTEVRYLVEPNHARYRALLRVFYEQHERLRHFLYPEELLELVMQRFPESEALREYNVETLGKDLRQLVVWKNLSERQDTQRVTSIEAFKLRKSRFSVTAYSIEIERMLDRLLELGDGFGGSLEKTLFQRLLELLRQLTRGQGEVEPPALALEPAELNQLWGDIHDAFRKLGRNASDYLAHLQSEQIETLLDSEAFLVFKTAFTDYLRDFVVELHKSSDAILGILRDTPSAFIQAVAMRVARHQATIPRLGLVPLNVEAQAQLEQGRWQGMRDWFLGAGELPGEWQALQNETNGAIRRVSRYAQRLAERGRQARSRQADYLHLARWFGELGKLDECHKLSSLVFGVEQPRKLVIGHQIDDDFDRSVWDKSPRLIELKPMTNRFHERSRPRGIIGRKTDPEARLKEHREKLALEAEVLALLTREGRLEWSQLADSGQLSQTARRYLLRMLGDALERPRGEAEHWSLRTDGGLQLEIRVLPGRAHFHSPDGQLIAPNFEFRLLQPAGSKTER